MNFDNNNNVDKAIKKLKYERDDVEEQLED